MTKREKLQRAALRAGFIVCGTWDASATYGRARFNGRGLPPVIDTSGPIYSDARVDGYVRAKFDGALRFAHRSQTKALRIAVAREFGVPLSDVWERYGYDLNVRHPSPDRSA